MTSDACDDAWPHVVDDAKGDVAWVHAHRADLLARARRYGAILLPAWAKDADHFAACVAALGYAPTDMACSAGPRVRAADGVFTANEAPPTERIPFHHEMAQCDAPPAFVLFCCDVPPGAGGATPLVRSAPIARRLRERHPAVAARLAREGLRYLRVLPPVTDASSALGKSWRDVLRVADADAAEAKLRSLGMEWSWCGGRRGGTLRTVSKAQPVLVHVCDNTAGAEKTEVLFTAAETTLNALADDAAAGTEESGANVVDESSPRPCKALLHADGAPLDAATQRALVDARDHMAATQTVRPWTRGDILLLDNATVMHGRATFAPPRRILAALVGTLTRTGHHLCRPPLPIGCSPTSTMDLLPSVEADGTATEEA